MSTVPTDVSPRPAGVDSPATLSRTSQTSDFVSTLQNQGLARGGPRVPMQNEAFIGGLGAGSLVSGAARALSRLPTGKLVGAGGAILAADTFIDLFGNEKKLVITRKLQRDVKKVFMMSAGDISFVAQNSGMLFGKNLSEDL